MEEDGWRQVNTKKSMGDELAKRDVMKKSTMVPTQVLTQADREKKMAKDCMKK